MPEHFFFFFASGSGLSPQNHVNRVWHKPENPVFESEVEGAEPQGHSGLQDETEFVWKQGT